MAHPALDHPDTRQAWSRQRMGGRLRLSTSLLAMAAGVATAALRPPAGVTAAAVAVNAAAFIFAFVTSVGLSRLKRVRRVLAVYAWTPYEASTVPDTGSRHKLITLLLADGGTTKRLIADWGGDPDIGADGTPVWFAGDPQFGGVIAPPGGGRLRYAAPYSVHKERQKRRNGKSTQDVLARQAGLLR
ncbi:MAG: hypothetical protein JWP76_3369 [Dactylosporangium sp.]|nr:hypothetical protein [Dactylosporangium sp.]